MGHDLTEARVLAAGLLSESMPRRWSHVAVVAERAQEVGSLLDVEASVLVSAAWLHDIGYAPSLVETGFHPLDGARYLRELGWPDRLVALVAHHSGALVEAGMRGLHGELAREFPREESLTADALWYCDLTTGPGGEPMTVEQRLAEVRGRYGPDHVVTRSVSVGAGDAVAAVRRTEERLRKADIAL